MRYSVIAAIIAFTAGVAARPQGEYEPPAEYPVEEPPVYPEPEVPEVPEVPTYPEEPEVPEVPEYPETPEVPEVPEYPEEPEVPEVPEYPEEPEVPEVPEYPEEPEEPEYPEEPEEPEYPEEPEVPYPTDVWETTVVTEYTTYCPSPTEVTHGDVTYTVTEPTTLTITDCPCTVSYPVHTSVVSECKTCSGTPAPPYPTGAPPETYYPTASQPAPSYSSYAPPEATGAANKAFAASGAGLAGVFGLAALVL